MRSRMEMLRSTQCFILLLLSMCLSMGTVSAVERQTYIVHTNGDVVGTTEDKAAAYQLMVTTVQAATGSFSGLGVTGISYGCVVSHVYEIVITGFAVLMTPGEATYMRTMPGVIGVFQETVMQLQTTHTPEEVGLEMMRSNGLWNVSRFGDDVIVGMLDTGVWPESESLSDTGLGPIPDRWRGQCVPGARFTTQNCNKKLIGARYFYQGYEAAVGPINGSEEYKSARDSDGHGTHTSSTAAGSPVPGASLFGLAPGVATGMAPKARIAAYKVCWASGCFSSDIIAGFDSAVADGVDVISVSLGGDPVDYFQDPIAIASFGAVTKGVFVSCAAGNSGPGAGTVSNSAPWITTVGASTVDRSFPVNVIVGNGFKTVPGISLYGGPGLGSDPLPLTTGSDCAMGNVSNARLCLPGSLDPNLVRGKIVLCYRGVTARVSKGQVVLAAGGAGMVLSNTADYGDSLIADPHVLPATFVGYIGGQFLEAYAAATTNPVASLTLPPQTVLGVKPAPAVTGFSSRGPTVQNPQLLKPDVIGPGLNILAAWPSETPPTQLSDDPRRVNFNIVSGTSMSCPHISGLGALIKAQHRTWSPAAIRSALMTTATFMDNSNSVITNDVDHMPATPYDYGSGFVQADKAADPGFIYDLSTQDYLNFLCVTGYSSQTLQLFTKLPNPCPSLPVLRMEDFNYPSFVAIFKVNSASSTFTTTFRRTVTNVGPARSNYTASFSSTLPDGYSVSVNPSTLVFTAVGQKLSYVLTVAIPATPLPPVETVYTFLSWTDGERVVNSPIVMEKQTA